jgi:hypothetical protein
MGKRKRAPGGGRKARSGPTSSLTFRIPDDLRHQLELEATAGATVSERLLWHLRRSFNRKREEERDPALQGLLFLIARLAERLSTAIYRADEIQSKNKLWRTDNFKFRAFKVAVKKLLDALEEPPPKPAIPEEGIRHVFKKWSTDPEFLKTMVENYKSPEALGASEFTDLWSDVMRSDEGFTDADYQRMRQVERDYPGHPYTNINVRENYGFRDARKALNIKSKTKRRTKADE